MIRSSIIPSFLITFSFLLIFLLISFLWRPCLRQGKVIKRVLGIGVGVDGLDDDGGFGEEFLLKDWGDGLFLEVELMCGKGSNRRQFLALCCWGHFLEFSAFAVAGF